MSMLGSNSNTMNTNPKPTLQDFKKQASFFLKEKIKTARLALTDVTSAQLLVEEATDGNPGGPDAPTLKMISKAAFEVDDYWRIVGILHKRLESFDERNWRASYKALIVLEYLLTHGPESVAQEFQKERDVITEMERFQYIDEKGFNWGFNVRKKCDRILKLLEKGPLLKEERERARKISRGIQGFGSFSLRNSSNQENDQESSTKTFERCNSQFNDRCNEYGFTLTSNEVDLMNKKTKVSNPKIEYSSSRNQINDEENVILKDMAEPLLNEERIEDDDPFDEIESHESSSKSSYLDNKSPFSTQDCDLTI